MGLTGYIAIVDDDRLVRQSLRDCVESAGYSVEEFGSAEAFLASASAQNAVCLILDVELPGMTGFDLQDRLAATDRPAPIVFVSAHGSGGNREHALRRGAAKFLSKPVRRESLLKAVAEAIQR